MDQDQKSLIFSVRKGLERGEVPSPKTLHKLLDLVTELDRKLLQETTLVQIQTSVTARLEERLDKIKTTVISKIDEAFI